MGFTHTTLSPPSANYADVVFGWNIKAYDIPYIFRRIENVLGQNAAKRLSPVSNYYIKQVNHDNERADVAAEIEVNVSGLFIADGLILYRDKFMINQTLDGGYSLDNVGEGEGLGHKIKYNGTLKDLYLKDYQKFYEYNVRDVDLAKKIDDKCKMIHLAKQITSFGLVDFNQIYSSIGYLTGSVISYSKKEFNKIFTSYVGKKKDQQTYEGAYVFPPVPGMYSNGIATIDFNSLYPSTIQSLNLSPETYVGKIIIYKHQPSGNYADIDEAFSFNNPDMKDAKLELKLPNNQRKAITIDQLKKLCDEKCILSKNNTLFLKHEIKWGLIAKWCKYFYAKRKATKKEMQKLDLAIYNKSITGKDADAAKVRIQNLNCMQISYKNMINSIYGLLGTSFSPLYNPDLAQTVTRNGKFCNISSSKYIHALFKQKYGIKDDYISTISGDTDSCDAVTKIRIITPKM
jgi:DNA polymerase elongation subunit (family B)